MIEVSSLVYGIHIQGELPAGFEPYLYSKAERSAHRERSIRVSYRVVAELPEVDEMWVAEPGAHAQCRFALFRSPAGFGLTVMCDGGGLFRITPAAIEIEWLPDGPGAAHYFFSYALPLWLESMGIAVLHASAVAFGNRAVAFLGQSGIGKSTLCAGLVRAGCGFVADDGLALREGEQGEWYCALGPPLLRLWPSALEDRLGIPAEELLRVHDSVDKRMMRCASEHDASVDGSLQLAAVYRLDRQSEDGTPVEITALSAREALVCLIEHSLAGGPVAALGFSGRRLERLSRAVARVPMSHLRYPGGRDHWPGIRKSIFDDLEARGATGDSAR